VITVYKMEMLTHIGEISNVEIGNLEIRIEMVE
jgi:hypothetical protein